METRLTQFETAGERPIVASGQLKAVHHVRTYERAVQATVARLRIEHQTCVATPLSSLMNIVSVIDPPSRVPLLRKSLSHVKADRLLL
jgi:hypothetical protein